MRILIIHSGSAAMSFAASSINKGLKRKYPHSHITWVVRNEEILELLKFSKIAATTYSSKQFWEFYDGSQFDLLINIHGSRDSAANIAARNKLGIGFVFNDSLYKRALDGSASIDMNLFQIYYRLAGMSWRGQGYDIDYRPRAKSRPNRVGLAAVNANLRNFIRDNLDLELSKLWVIPYKRDLFRRMDEINKCKTIVTDDALTMHLAVYLRKNVHYLQTVPVGFKVEMFGRGKVYEVPPEYIG